MKNITIIFTVAFILLATLSNAGIGKPTPKGSTEISKTIDFPGAYNGESTTQSPDGTHSTISINCLSSPNTVCFTSTVPCVAPPGNTDVENGDLNAINTYPSMITLRRAGGTLIGQGIAVFYSNTFINGDILDRLHTFIIEL